MAHASRSECLTAALRYAARGWSVFPLDGKRPFSGTHGYKDATIVRKDILRWWRRWPSANVGIACSSLTGPIVVDVDGSSGQRLLDTLELPETRMASSRKNRFHLYFDPMEDGTTIQRTIKIQGTSLDILGDGGYVVAPPSVHPETGRPYKWLRKIAPLPLPAQIFQLVRRTESLKKIAPPLPAIIGEGERDSLLTSLAGTMRRRGASTESILAALREENATRVRPPLGDRQLQKIAGSIGKKTPVSPLEHMTDLGNARRFVHEHHDEVRSVLSNKKSWSWLKWSGTHWIPDTMGEVERLAKKTVRKIHSAAAECADDDQRDQLLKHAMRSESASRLRGMIELAATEPECSASTEQFDKHLWYLNVENGTIDLRTGELRPHSRDDLITKLAPVRYDPDKHAPRWEQFLMEIMDGDQELVEFLQRAVGYSLTGDTREQCLFFCYGQGANGKSTFLETLRHVFGDYAQQADFNSFMARNGDGPRTDIARMHGARFVTASEAQSNKDFDARVVQLLTGEDTVVARQLYEREFEFKPQHKLWLAANHKPVVKEQTEAFWRRMRLIPFTVTFKKKDRDDTLRDRLRRKEINGILTWAVQGCVRWYKEGLLEPMAVRKATRSYKDENDLLGEFLAASAVIRPDQWTPTPLLYRTFSDWWQETRGTRSQPISMAWFGRLMGERPEFTQVKKNNVRGWRGIGVLTSVKVQ